MRLPIIIIIIIILVIVIIIVSNLLLISHTFTIPCFTVIRMLRPESASTAQRLPLLRAQSKAEIQCKINDINNNRA